MSTNVFLDVPLSDAQLRQDYSLQAVKNVNDAADARLTLVESKIPVGPDGGDHPPAAIGDLTRRFVLTLGGVNYYLYCAPGPAPP